MHKMFLQDFLNSHRDYALLASLTEEEQKVVRWAHENHYVQVETVMGGYEVVSMHNRKKAKMWWNKHFGEGDHED